MGDAQRVATINKNAIYNIVRNIAAVIFPLITFPYVSRVLGAEGMGKVSFGMSVVNYFSLVASLGISVYGTRECAAVRKEKKLLSRMASQIFSINILSTIAAFIILLSVLCIFPSLYPYRALILILSASIFFTTLGADWLNTAMEDFRYITIRTIVVQFVSTIVVFALVHDKKDYYIYAWVWMLAIGGANILNVFYRRRYCKVCLTRRMEIRRHLPPIMVLFFMLMAQSVFVNMDTTMLGLVKGDVETGLYGVSTRIYNMVNTIVASIAWVVMPQMAELFSKKDYQKINQLLRHSLNFIIVLGMPIAIGLYLLASEIIQVLAGMEYIKAVTSLRILAFSLVFSYAGGFVGNIILLPSKRGNIMLFGSVVCAVINFMMNLMLIPAYGLNAAAATTTAANAVGFLVGLPFIEKEIHISGIWTMIKAPLAGSCCMAFFVIWIIHSISNLYVRMGVSLAGGACVYFLVLLMMRDEFCHSFFAKTGILS